MNRREFVQRFFAMGVTVAIPFQWAYGQIRHRLCGDGKSDDTVAFQALLDGEPVIMPDGKTVQSNGVMIHLPEGTYRITNTLKDPGIYPGTIDGKGSCLRFDTDEDKQ